MKKVGEFADAVIADDTQLNYDFKSSTQIKQRPETLIRSNDQTTNPTTVQIVKQQAPFAGI
jgi:hypothetical protein